MLFPLRLMTNLVQLVVDAMRDSFREGGTTISVVVVVSKGG